MISRLRLKSGDRRQAFVAAATLIGALLVVFVVVGLVQRSIAAAAIARAEHAVQERQEAALRANRLLEAYRTGSIVFAADQRECEELQFDNFTGAFISWAQVDCAKRLREMAHADEKAAAGNSNANSMRGMLDSFKK